MTQIFGYICSDRNVTADLFKGLHEELGLYSAQDSAGFGMGWIQEDRSLLRTYPKPAPGTPSLLNLLADLPSRVMVATVRKPGERSVSSNDLAPFRFRRWVWASTEAPGATADGLPDYIRQNIHGRSSAEALFHAVLKELHAVDGIDDPKIDDARVAAAISRAVAGLERFPTLLLATGKRMFALAGEQPLFYRLYEGYELQEEPAFAGHKPKPRTLPAFRAAVLTTAPSGLAREDWREVPTGQVIGLDTSADPRFF